jgi:hypothetical protein
MAAEEWQFEVKLITPTPEKERHIIQALVKFMAPGIAAIARERGLTNALPPEEFARRHKLMVDYYMANPQATSVPPELLAAQAQPDTTDANTTLVTADQPKTESRGNAG